MTNDHGSKTLAGASLAAGLLLATLCAIIVLSGVSQQRFEWVQPPAEYAARLVHDAGPLRLTIAIDDLFIVAYTLATLSLARSIGTSKAIAIVIGCGGVAAGLLDFHENHQILAMLRMAEQGTPISADVILTRSELSQLKWLVGHATFVLVGVSLPAPRTRLERSLVVSLVVFQLPVGVLVWVTSGLAFEIFVWVRYASFLAGFFVIAALARDPLSVLGRRRDDVGADARGALA